MPDTMKTNEDLLILASKGDRQAQEDLITQNTGLVHSVVRRFAGRGHEMEDLFQVGCIGLLKAVQKFDLSFGVKFSTYAVPMIMGEIKRFLRDDGIIKVSRNLKETAAKAMKIREALTAQNGTEPSLKEIADRLEITPSELAVALDAATRPESIYATVDNGTNEGVPLLDKLENGVDYEAEITNRLALRQVLAEFDEREQRIIAMRYFKQKTQVQVARVLGISQVQVSRIEKKLLLRMREKIANDIHPKS